MQSIQVQQYISETVQEIPAGVIIKSHTGMGATHLELHSKRHSIIVEPVRSTAAAKHNSFKGTKGFDCLYVGSAIGNLQKPSDIEITLFLKKKTKRYKKILCVADSLPGLMEKLQQENNPQDYFLLIDEVDSFQMDSSFRQSLEKCIDIYWEFPESHRALLTATPLQFSDVRLQKEHHTRFNLSNPSPTPILVSYAPAMESAILTKVVTLLRDANNPVVVAYNSVSSILSLIGNLLKLEDCPITPADIGVLCSEQSKYRVEEYFKTLSEDRYPSRLTFITSAFFTGYDIKEPYHLVLGSSVNRPNTLLSVNQIKQISGRLREQPLLSNHFFYHPIDKYSLSADSADKLIAEFQAITEKALREAGNKLIDSMKCLKHHFEGYQDTYNLLNTFSQGALDSLQHNNKAIIRKPDNSQEFVLSYFFIDSKLANKESFFQVYINNNPKRLSKALHQVGFAPSIESFECLYDIEKIPDTRIAELENQVIQEWTELMKNQQEELLDRYLTHGAKEHPLSTVRNIGWYYSKLRKHFSALEFMASVKKELIRESKTAGEFQFRDKRAQNNFLLKTTFLWMPEDVNLRINLHYHFQNGQAYNRVQIIQKLRQCFVNANMYAFKEEIKPKTVMTLFGFFVDYTYTTRKEFGTERVVIVKGIIPSKAQTNPLPQIPTEQEKNEYMELTTGLDNLLKEIDLS